MEPFPEKKKRPPTVWLTQVLIALLGLSFSSGLFRGVYSAITGLDNTGFNTHRLVGLTLGIGFLTILGGALWGLTKKIMWGKWLGVFSLTLMWGLVLYGQLFPSSGSIQRYEYNNTAQLAGANAFMITINFLFGFLILRLALAKKVNSFFQS